MLRLLGGHGDVPLPLRADFPRCWTGSHSSRATVEADPVCRSGVDDGRVVSVAHDCDVYVGHRAVVVVGAVSPVAAEEADHLSAGRIFVPRSNLYRIAKLPGASGVDASAA